MAVEDFGGAEETRGSERVQGDPKASLIHVCRDSGTVCNIPLIMEPYGSEARLSCSGLFVALRFDFALLV